MSETRFRARVRDRPGALERVIGLLRRRAFAVHRLSVAHGANGVFEIVLRTGTERTPAERVETDLRALVDVLEVQRLEDGQAGATRELVLARVDPLARACALGVGRPIVDHAGGVVLEITGAPEEVDDALRRLAERGILVGFVRTGEIPLPDSSGQPQGGEVP